MSQTYRNRAHTLSVAVQDPAITDTECSPKQYQSSGMRVEGITKSKIILVAVEEHQASSRRLCRKLRVPC